MAFSEDRALPGSALQLDLEAAPGSLCAVRAVDRSVLLLKPEAELNAEAVSGGIAQGPFCSPRDQLGVGGEEMTLAWTFPTGTWCHGGSWAVLLLEGGRCLAGFVPSTRVYSQVYKVLPEFDYPERIRDPLPCSEFSLDYPPDFDIPFAPLELRRQGFFRRPWGPHFPFPFWRNTQMDTYKLFQVKALPVCASWSFFIQEPAVVCSGCRETTATSHESHTHGKGLSLSHGHQAPVLLDLSSSAAP